MPDATPDAATPCHESKISIWLQKPLSEDSVMNALARAAVRLVDKWEPDRARAVAAELVGLHCFTKLASERADVHAALQGLMNMEEAAAVAHVTGLILENAGEVVAVDPAEQDHL